MSHSQTQGIPRCDCQPAANSTRWHAIIMGHRGRADTAPLAICLAALKAVGENVD